LQQLSCQEAVENLSTNWKQAVRTHPVDKLLEQHCYKSAAGLLQLESFYVCIMNMHGGFFVQNKLRKSYILEKRREYLHQTAFFEVSWLNAMNKYLYDLEKNKEVID
jgi:hypothetical protein